MNEPSSNAPPSHATPSTTEDVPATPGWVEQSLDEILGDAALGLAAKPSLRGLRNTYLDCLASAGRSTDIDETHDRCRRQFLAGLAEQEGMSAANQRYLQQKLEALEAEISASI